MVERVEKVNEVIREELGKIILKNVEFESGILATITKVETSADLRYAKILITVLPESEEKKVFDSLKKNEAVLQKELVKKLRMKPVPKIHFEPDKAQKVAQRVEELLVEAEKNG